MSLEGQIEAYLSSLLLLCEHKLPCRIFCWAEQAAWD